MKRSPRWSALCISFTAIAVLATACSSGDTASNRADGPVSETPTIGASDAIPSIQDETEPRDEGVTLTIDGGQNTDLGTEILLSLSEGSAASAGSPIGVRAVATTALDDDDIDRLLMRLPDLDELSSDRVQYARPAETRPPPRSGETIDISFPPDAAAQRPTALEPDKLEVLRYQPDGDVAIAPFISVTFNQPMVALGTTDQLDIAEVPIEITPELPGRWVWLGTRTARFEYEPDFVDRAPMSTSYRIAVRSGTTAVSGAELESDVQFAFTTPTTEVLDVVPLSSDSADSLATDQVFVVLFNQRITPAEVLGHLRLTADGNAVPLILLSADEVAADVETELRTQNAADGRWVAVRTETALPTDASIEFSTTQGLPSAEGPEVGSTTQRFSGRTYAPLELTTSRCGWGQNCEPGQPFVLEFSNQIETESFDTSAIRVEPAIEAMNVGVSFNQIVINGVTDGRTDYRVRVETSLTDIFGQQLAEPAVAEFAVGDAPAALFPPNNDLVTLDPILDDAVLRVTSINNDELRVKIWRVDPVRDWRQYREQRWQIGEGSFEPEWEFLGERDISTRADANKFIETALDLGPELGPAGHVVVRVSPTESVSGEWQNQPFAVWVQRTNLGIDAYADTEQAVVRVTDLRSGEAVADASIDLGRQSGTTNDDGLAFIDLGAQAQTVVATTADQTAILSNFWVEANRSSGDVRWYVADDRGLYKPGETAYIKGWIRQSQRTAPSRLDLPPAGAEVQWEATDAFGNQFANGQVELNTLGGFDLAIEIPTDITLGPGGIQFETDAFAGSSDNRYHWHQLTIQQFRRPDFEVAVQPAFQGPYLHGDDAILTATSSYFAGDALASSPIDWTVEAVSATYAPPQWPDFDFGVWQPWWFNGGFGSETGFTADTDFGGPRIGGGVFDNLSSTTAPDGTHQLAINVATQGKPRPVALTATATTFDVNRQPVSGSTNLLSHPANLYVGLRGPRTFIAAGERLDFDVVATDIDGNLVAEAPISVTTSLIEWRFQSGRWQEVDIPAEVCDITSADQPVMCSFEPEMGGRYRVTATLEDTNGRRNLTEVTRWVSGGDRPPSRRLDLEQLTLVPSGERFEPGTTAEVLVQAPFADANGLLIVTRGLISETRIIDFDDAGSAVVAVDITEQDIPGIGLQIEVVGTALRPSSAEPSPRPAFASGQISLTVPPTSRTLHVDAVPRDATLAPGSNTEIDVRVTDASGVPVAGADLAVIVVDEAVLSLTGYNLENPVDAFYRNFGTWIQSARGRSTVVLGDRSSPQTVVADGEEIADASSNAAVGADGDEAFGSGSIQSEGAFDMAAADDSLARAPAATVTQAKSGETAQAISLRDDFDALAIFEPSATTDVDGRVLVQVPIPDNLTRYRIMVVAAADAGLAGSDEASLTARLPITVRPTPPRFANFGDRFEFPVVVQNATSQDRSINVALRATNLVLTGERGVTVEVPANDRVEVRFNVEAEVAGIARWQIAATSGDLADAAEGEFPVYTPATSEAFATYGVIDGGSIRQRLDEPENVFTQFGGLEVSTSSTAVSSLTDAVVYLGEYRYQSSDALAARVLALTALGGVFEAFDTAGAPTLEQANEIIASDIERLIQLQNDNGGFPWWRRGRESIPWVSVQAAHALVIAANAGFDVPGSALNASLAHIGTIESHMPSSYAPQTKQAISAYALHVRHLAGDDDLDKALSLWGDLQAEPQLDAIAWIWPVVAADPQADGAIERLFENRVTERANQATFATDYGDQQWLLLHSDRRSDAVVLDALLRQRPQSDLVVKTLAGLLAARDSRGRWNNVQENSFVLIAAANYFEQVEGSDPDFVARAWLGDTFALEQSFTQRDTGRYSTTIPMQELVGVGSQDIVVDKVGDGRLYYRLGLRYAPSDLAREPIDQGFVVQRSYEAIDADDDVAQSADGTWTIQAGARVRVRLSMVADSRRTHVALLDPIPAGFEMVNPALATTEVVPSDEPSGRTTDWWYRWFDHQNLRDDRAEAFATWLAAGTYEYSYVVRATTPGTFVVPPSRAEQIYEPENFGRSASTTVTIAG